jgi:hypothetical protein
MYQTGLQVTMSCYIGVSLQALVHSIQKHKIIREMSVLEHSQQQDMCKTFD